MNLTLADFYVVGLTMDIVGGALLVRGLLMRPSEIHVLGTWAGLGTGSVLERCRNRVDATFGLSYLLAGFGLQIVGYALELAGAGAAEGGSSTLLTALLLTAATVLVTLGVYRLRYTPALKRTMVKVAKSRPGTGKAGDEATTDWTREKVKTLAKLGEAAGWLRSPDDRDGITAVNYIQRVFGVSVPPFPIEDA